MRLYDKNIYWLFNNLSKLAFESDQAEAEFWARPEISVCVMGNGRFGQPLWPCAYEFRSGRADLIEAFPFHQSIMYRAYNLLKVPEIVLYRARVRKLTEHMLGAQMDEELARAAAAINA
jgi:hypothetical protein